MKKNEEKLLKEYVSFIINEYDSFSAPGAGGAALKRAFAGAAKDAASAIVGAGKQVGAAAKQTIGMTYEALKNIGSFGIFKANYDKVAEKYKNDLQNISNQHGSAMRSANDAFLNVLGPIGTIAKAGLTGAAAAVFFSNPAAFIAAEGVASAAARKAPELKAKIKSKIDKMAGDEPEKDKKENKSIKDPEFKDQREGLSKVNKQVKQIVEKEKKELLENVNNIINSNSLQDLKFSNDDIEKIKKQEKDANRVVSYGKKIKLKALLESIKSKRNSFYKEAKDAFGNTIPDSALTAKGGLIYEYDQIIRMIQEKINSIN